MLGKTTRYHLMVQCRNILLPLLTLKRKNKTSEIVRSFIKSWKDKVSDVTPVLRASAIRKIEKFRKKIIIERTVHVSLTFIQYVNWTKWKFAKVPSCKIHVHVRQRQKFTWCKTARC